MTQSTTNNLVRGTLDIVVLQALTQASMHGFAIARWIRENSGDVVCFEDAALYQSLHRLERRGFVTSSWGRSENNRRARFYRLTPKGKKRLGEETRAFHRYAAAVTRLLGGRP